jgi:ATP-dependent RNA helicase RhlB
VLTFLKKTIDKLRSAFPRSTPALHPTIQKKSEGTEAGKTKAVAAERIIPKKPSSTGKQRTPPAHSKDKNRIESSTSGHCEEPRTLPPLKEILFAEGKTRFADLPIAQEVLCGIQDLGFQFCTPIQAECLPPALAGKDVAGKAQTGTGKTAAFLAAAFTHLIRNPKDGRTPGSCRVLVLAPTRELAIQINDDAEVLAKYCGLTHLAVYGGMGFDKQRDALRRQPIDVLVGTPGRILDYCTRRDLHLSNTEILVIDEADRMLDMGFMPDVRRIVRKLPPAGNRQTMLFSATLTEEIVRLQAHLLANPVRIETEPETMVTDLIKQMFYSVSSDDKLALLLWILKNDDVERMLVFCNRKDSAEMLARTLRRRLIRSELLSGDVSQQNRLRILDNFRIGKTPVVVATDVAARGIHVDALSHVVNYDLPDSPEDYVHRIGRTGRAGTTGKSISFACEYGAYLIPELEKFLDSKIVCINPTQDMLSLPPLPALASNRAKKAVAFRTRAQRPQQSADMAGELTASAMSADTQGETSAGKRWGRSCRTCT